MIAIDIIAIIEFTVEGNTMKMKRLIIQVTVQLKSKLDTERKRGTSAAGLIRHLLEEHFKSKKAA